MQELVALDALAVDYEETGEYSPALHCVFTQQLRMTCSLSMLPSAVFCAVAHWMSAQRRLSRAQKKAAAALLLPHIRFPLMRPTMVTNFWHALPWFRWALVYGRQASCRSALALRYNL